MSRLAFLSLWLLTLGALAGCPYGNGAVCEIDSDCASDHCCGARPTSGTRGVCIESGAVCGTTSFDAGVVDAGDAPSADEDAPEPIDAGPEDTGVDAPEDTGVDAPEEDDAGVDAGMDAGSDAGSDAGADAGVDAPT